MNLEQFSYRDSNRDPVLLLPECPLLLVDQHFLSEWKGIDSDDYERACAVEGYCGRIRVGSGYGVILNDVPLATRFLKTGTGAVAIVCGFLEEFEIAGILDCVDQRAATDIHSLHAPTGRMVLFEAGNPGDDPDQSENRALVFWDFLPGDYRVETFALSKMRPDGLPLVVHRIVAS